MALLYQLRNERGRLWVIIFGKSRNKRDDTGILIEINGRWDLEIYLGVLHEKDIYLVKALDTYKSRCVQSAVSKLSAFRIINIKNKF